jgi:glycosyltransferase involved in cell wall biosynthesis
MRLHLVGLPYSKTTTDFVTCAFTNKVVSFARMMMAAGHEVYLYAADENDAPCTELIPILTDEERVEWFGEWNLAALPGAFSFDANYVGWRTFNARVVGAIAERAEPRDIICLSMGTAQRSVATANPSLLTVEYGVGYPGVFAQARAFESYAWAHHLAAKEWAQPTDDARWFDAVIPGGFDPDHFHTDTKDDYLLFVGRLISRKGPHIAGEIAKRMGRRLLLAGPGCKAQGPGWVEAEDGTRIEGDVEHIGPLNIKERADVMSRATTLIVPTIYLEPFGCVAVEAMMCGTPAVASDWGAFTETVQTGVSGYRFRTLTQGVQAVERAEKLHPAKIRAYAMANYSLETVGDLYDQWLNTVYTLYGPGWYA